MKSGMVPAGTSVMPIAGWRTNTGEPHEVQKLRRLFSVRLVMPILSAPFFTLTFGVGQSVAAWIGAPSQLRHELQ